jgi:hypothetical protein
LFYFEQFNLLELELYLVTLGCKPFRDSSSMT